MTGHIGDYTDKNGLVKTHLSDDSSGNGLLYSYLYMRFCHAQWTIPVYEMLYDIKKGCLHRAPDLSYGIESHDDYLALALYLYESKQWFRAQCVFEAAFFKGFYLKDVPFSKEEMSGGFKRAFKEIISPWLIPFRFPIPWIIMFAAAYPSKIVDWISRTLIRLISGFQLPNVSDASATQLQFITKFGIMLMGDPIPLVMLFDKLSLSKVMVQNNYYDLGHPIVAGFEDFQKGFLMGREV